MTLTGLYVLSSFLPSSIFSLVCPLSLKMQGPKADKVLYLSEVNVTVA